VTQSKLFLSPAEVAAELDVSTTTVLRLIHTGRLPAIRVSERIFRVPVASFELFKAGAVRVPKLAPLGAATSRPRLGAGEELPRATRPRVARAR